MRKRINCFVVAILILFNMVSHVTNGQTYFLDAALDGQTIYYQGQSIELYDSGGPDNPYSVDEDFEVTFCVDDGLCDYSPGWVLSLMQISIENSNSCIDELNVSYNGNTTIYCDANLPIPGFEIFGTDARCVTINFYSDFSVNQDGFHLILDLPSFDSNIISLSPNQTLQGTLGVNQGTGDPFTTYDYGCQTDLIAVEDYYEFTNLSNQLYEVSVIGDVSIFLDWDVSNSTCICVECNMICGDENNPIIFDGTFDPVIGNHVGVVVDALWAEDYSITLTPISSSACDEVIPLSCGETIQDETYIVSNFNESFYSNCAPGFSGSGPDKIYSFERYSYSDVNYITLQQLSQPENDMFLFSDCDGGEVSSCISMSYHNGNFLPSDVKVYEITNLDPGTYYIVVDSENDDVPGSTYRLSVSCEGFNCSNADPILCGEIVDGTINNADDVNYNSGYNSNCLDIPGSNFNDDQANGMFTSGEDVYTFFVEEDGTYKVYLDIISIENDLELFVYNAEDCCDGFNPTGGNVFISDGGFCPIDCINGSTNASGDETIVLENLEAGDEIIIVIDGFLYAEGDYKLEIICNNLDCSLAQPLTCGQVKFDNNFTAENNVEEYCESIDLGSTLIGPEVVYQFTAGFERASFYLTNPNGQDLDMFLLPDCDPSDCIATSDDENSFAIDLIANELINSNENYYLVVDADDDIETDYVLNVNCGPSCLDILPLECGVTYYDNIPNTLGVTYHYSFYKNSTGFHPGEQYFSEYNGHEVLYEFIVDEAGTYRFQLDLQEQVEMNVLVALECNGQSNIFDIIATSASNFPSGQNFVEVLLQVGAYTVILDSKGGTSGLTSSSFTLTVSGCETEEYCDLVTPYLEDDTDQIPYVLFEDDQLPNNVISFIVNYPLDTTGMGGYQFTENITPSADGELEYECPEPGCYDICFYYENEEGSLDYCCIKYCAEFPVDDCINTPIIKVIDEDIQTGTTECYFSCPPDIILGLVQSVLPPDSSYISVTGNGIDTTLVDGPAGTILLPNGQYEVCCWEYDAACDYWSICCETYCLPYIDPADQCTPVFNYVGDGTYSGFISSLTLPSISPSEGVSAGFNNSFGTIVTEINFENFGTYKVCYDIIEDQQCCEYICYEVEEEENECFSIEYENDGTVQLTCLADDVLSWHWIALCPPPGDCISGELIGDRVSWEIPQYEGKSEYQICKFFEGCCGQVESCCDTICYSLYEPYEFIGDGEYEYIECADVRINDINIDSNGDISGEFEYTGSATLNAYWEIYITDVGGPPSPFKIDKKGSNRMIFITDDDGPDDGDEYIFQPDETYSVCYTYIGDDGCREYCCIKVEIPESCDDHTPAYETTTGGLNFSYTVDSDLPGQVQDWYITDGQEISDNGDVASVEYNADGTYTICCLTYDELSNCYKLCCKEYCIQDPLECGVDINPTNNGDGTWDLDQFDTYNFGAMWMIDRPLQYAQVIDPNDVHNFDPLNYGIPSNTELTISVKYTDVDGCTRICCKPFCSDPDGSCEIECYDSCCEGENLSWLDDIIDQISPSCQEQDLTNGSIRQASNIEGCFYYVLRPGSIFNDMTTTDVYQCNGDLVETLEIDDLNYFEAMKVVWTCNSGLHPLCEEICPNSTEIYCENFVYLPSGPLSDNLENWTQIGSVDQENAVSNEGGLLDMVDGGHSRYSIPFDNIDKICFSLNLTGEQETLSNASFALFDESNNEIRVDLSGWESIIGSNIEVFYNGVNQLGPLSIAVDNGTFNISLIWTSGEFSIDIDGVELARQSITEVGSISSFDVISFGGVNGNQNTLLSNLCFKSCEECSDDFTYSSETFESCTDLTIVNVTNASDDEATVSVAYDGLETSAGYDIYEIVDGNPVLQDSNNTGTWTCGVDRDYLFCYTYLDDDGCTQYCCIKVRIPSSCGLILPTYTGASGTLEYQFSYEGDNLDPLGWFGEDGIFLEGATNGTVIYDAPGQYTICCLLWDEENQCFSICCKTICAEDPLECSDVIVENFEVTSGTFDLALNSPGTEILQWQIDAPQNFAQVINDPSNFDPGSLGIPEGDLITVSVTYIGADGCAKICCKTFCSSGPENCEPCTPMEPDCDLFTVDTIPFNGDWVFDFDDLNNDDLKKNTYITEPDGNVVTQSGLSNMYTGSQEGTYIFCRIYEDECLISYECCDTICVLQEALDCSQDITVMLTGDTTAVFTQMITGGSSYVWNFGDGTIIEDASTTVTHIYPNITASYTAMLTVTNACGEVCIKMIDVTIISETEEFVVVPLPEDLSCENNEDGSIELIISGGTEPYIIDWYNGPDGEAMIDDLPTGEYIVTVSEAGGEEVTLTITLSAPEVPIITIVEEGTSCGNNNGAVTVTPLEGSEPSEYILSRGSTEIESSQNGSFNDLPAGTYSMALIYGEDCILDIDFEIAPSEDILLVLDDIDVICETSVLLDTDLEGDEYTFKWSLNGVEIEGENLSFINVVMAGEYEVTVDNASCLKTAMSTVSFIPKADISNMITNTTCGEDNGSIMIISENDVSIATITNNGQEITGEELVALSAGSYNLLVTDENGCTTEVNIDIEESSVPELIVNATNADCGEGDGSIMITSVDGTPITSITNDQTGEVTTGGLLSGLIAEDYILIVTDINGCSQMVFESIESEADFLVDLGENLTICVNENMELSTKISSDMVSFEWYLEGKLLEDALSSTYLPTEPGQYIVNVMDNEGCTAEDTIVINYFPSLIEVNGESGNFLIGESLLYEVYGAETIDWFSTDIDLSCDNCDELTATVTNQGSINLKAIDINGCIEQFTFTINVDNELIFPNYLTPNNDGFNDKLEFVGLDPSNINQLIVYNKRGQEIYETTDYIEPWDLVGADGNLLSDGVYYYSIEYQIGTKVYRKMMDLTILNNQ